MRRFSIILGLVLVSITLLAIACTGDQGLAGPTGPQGEQGQAGAAGPQGRPGPVAAPARPGAQGPRGPAGPAGEPASTGPADAPVELVAVWAATAATARYQDIEQAISDGYAQATDCWSEPQQGAQGFHYLNAALLDDVVDPTKPEFLMYIPSETGKLRLVGVEYAVPDSEPTPSLFGQTFQHAPRGAPLLGLHAWLWEANPDGVFADWNPSLSCIPLKAGGAVIDAMTHPLSQALTDALSGGGVPFSGAEELIALLDEANVDKAVMMSLGLLGAALPDDAAVRAENDFVAGEVAKFPGRLIGFCGVNPLYSGAIEELDRCLNLDGMVGIKMAVNAPQFVETDLTNPDHVAALSAMFDKAQEHDAPVQLHSQTPMDPAVDPDALANLAAIIADHPDVRVNHSHCAGVIDEHSSQFWLQTMRPNPDSAFLDLGLCLRAFEDAPLSKRELIVWRLRQWGVERLLFSSDHLRLLEFPTPGQALLTLGKYPFTQEEIELITSNDASAWLEGR